jgi:hypothetical protein
VTDIVESFVEVMRDVGAFKGDDGHRYTIARRLVAEGVTQRELAEFVVSHQTGTLSDPGVFIQSKLSKPGFIKGYLEDDRRARKANATAKKESKASKSSKPFHGSGARFCCAQNPYGWSDASEEALLTEDEQGLFYDHNRPGEWNGFRQSCNLTEEEARDEGRDGEYRREGVSRWAAIGHHDKPEDREPSSPDWDPWFDDPVDGDPKPGRKRRDHCWDEDRGPQTPPTFEDLSGEEGRVFGE